jgi:HSP20 family molecular chaperone IbpA
MLSIDVKGNYEYNCMYRLNDTVDISSCKAEYKDGILYVRFDKKVKKVKKIEIS